MCRTCSHCVITVESPRFALSLPRRFSLPKLQFTRKQPRLPTETFTVSHREADLFSRSVTERGHPTFCIVKGQGSIRGTRPIKYNRKTIARMVSGKIHGMNERFKAEAVQFEAHT